MCYKQRSEGEKQKLSDGLTDLIEKKDEEMAELSGLPPELHTFQRLFNPEVYYCRLRDIGMDKKVAKEIVREHYLVMYDKIKLFLVNKYLR